MTPGRRVVEPVGSCPTYFLLFGPVGPWAEALVRTLLQGTVKKRGRKTLQRLHIAACLLAREQCLCGFTTLPGLREPTTYHAKDHLPRQRTVQKPTSPAHTCSGSPHAHRARRTSNRQVQISQLKPEGLQLFSRSTQYYKDATVHHSSSRHRPIWAAS